MRITLIITFFLIANLSFSQKKIDQQQARIDSLDGKLDNYLSIIDLDDRNSATYTYFSLVDLLQKAILTNNIISISNKNILFNELEKELKEITPNRLTKSHREEKRFTFLLEWVKALSNNEAEKLMMKQPNESFKIINYIYPFDVTKNFLFELPNNYIDQILFKYKFIKKTEYGQQLLEKIVVKAPLSAKKFFIRNQPVYNSMHISTDPTINTIYSINEKFRRNTKAFVLIDKIMNNELTIEEADLVGKNDELYFKSLLEIRAKEKPLAEVSLDRELNYEALNYVRKVNQLHEASDRERFHIVKDLQAKELYTLIVFSEDEIFTSSFNGIYKNLEKKLKSEKISGFELLEQVGFNRFRKFIKIASYYGKLSEFLNTMKQEEKNYILRNFIGGITNSKNKIEDAVSIVNAISSIEDGLILEIFEEELYKINTKANITSESRLIYGLLAKMFQQKAIAKAYFFDSLAQLYYTPPIDKIELKTLLGKDNINVQKHFFYDDEDGIASYNSFKAVFKNSNNWTFKEEKQYIKIMSTNNRVKIYANKPKDDETAWYYVNKEIEKNKEDIEIIIHRGHSYYVEETIEKLTKGAKLILLGSCGGYNRLSELLEKSGNAQIISTKQIGSMAVNNPLIFQMAEKIRNGADLDWNEYWSSLKIYFQDKGKAREQFEDYVPPHQNLGARFIAAYNMYNWVN